MELTKKIQTVILLSLFIAMICLTGCVEPTPTLILSGNVSVVGGLNDNCAYPETGSDRDTLMFAAHLTNGFSGKSNDIILKRAKVYFLFRTGTLARERAVNIIIPSDGGEVTVGIPLISGGNDSIALKTLFKSDIEDAGAPLDSSLKVVVKIRMYGKSASGTLVESNTYKYLITFCTDCDLDIAPACVAGI